MFRVSAEIESLNCDEVLIQVFDTVKRMQDEGMLDNMPAGMQIPPFISPDLLKRLPQNQKLSMLAEGLNKEKARVIPMIQNILSASLGQITLSDYEIEIKNQPECQLIIRAEISAMEPDSVMDRMITDYLQEEDIPILLGEHYDEKLNRENIGFYMHGQSSETKEYLTLKMMSEKKKDLMKKITEYAKNKDVQMTMKNLRFFLKEK